MTNNQLNRERVVALIAEHSYDSALVDALEHLLAAMDSEPVAVTDDELNAALQLHRLKVDGHSQLSDAFRAGFRYARRTTPQPAPERAHKWSYGLVHPENCQCIECRSARINGVTP